ncbi:MAG: hypothetical protein MK078_00180 [Crocinitomicaceae bacterium]|nr:hypothetical protein [Crocinitomicaceae bacterium]
MKRTLLFLAAVITLGANAQNVDDEKVNFRYTQLPTHPIDAHMTLSYT